MSGPTVGVLALQGDVREHRAMLEACGAGVRQVRLPQDLAGLQGLILPGGESTTMARLIDRFGLEQPLREAMAGGTACLATCAGTILAAREVLDGLPGQMHLDLLDISVRRNAFGRQVHSAEALLDVPAVGPEPVPVAFIRAPSIERVGAGVEVLARYRERPAAVREGRHMALTFHPEITGDERLHRLFLSAL